VRGKIETVNSLLRPKMPLLTELGNLFRLGLQRFRAYGAGEGRFSIHVKAFVFYAFFCG
jgi:hypothetical protein